MHIGYFISNYVISGSNYQPIMMTNTRKPVVVPCGVEFVMCREYSNKDFFSPAASNKYGPIEFQSNLYWNLLKFLSPLQCKFSWAILYLKYSSKPFLNIWCKPNNLSSKTHTLSLTNNKISCIEIFLNS